jgi:FMN phosphatase YigB (HAD superfamily)
VLDDIGVAAGDTVMFEDSLKNVAACRRLGMRTVFVTSDDPEQGLGEAGGEAGGAGHLAALADAVVSACSLAQLKTALPSLWP